MPKINSLNSPRNHTGPVVATLEGWCRQRMRRRQTGAAGENDGDKGHGAGITVDDLSRSLQELSCAPSPPYPTGDAYWVLLDERERHDAARRTLETYNPERVTTFTIGWAEANKYHPTDVHTISSTLVLPADTPPPVFRPPPLPLTLNSKLPSKCFWYGPTTLVPMLVAAERAAEKQRRESILGSPHTDSWMRPTEGQGAKGEDIPLYSRVDIVTQRGNLNKVALDDEWWAVGAQKIGGVLFLRRYIERGGTDVNMIGFQFERACCPPYQDNAGGRAASASQQPATQRSSAITNRSPYRDPDFQSFFLVTSGTLGRFRILLESEVDAIGAASRDSPSAQCLLSSPCHSRLAEKPPQVPVKSLVAVELKCTVKKPNSVVRKGQWLQARLAGIDKIIYGYRRSTSSDDVVDMKEFLPGDIAVEENAKASLFAKIEQALEFLSENVPEDGGVYIFRREKVEGAEAGQNGKKPHVKVLRRIPDNHAFVSEKMLRTVPMVCRNSDI